MTVLPEIQGFRVIDEIGSGAMGMVYAAEALEPFAKLDSGCKTAIKVLRSEMLEQGHARDRFERELEVGITLEDASLMRMYGSGKTLEGLPFVAMELLDGRVLSDLIEDNSSKFDADEAVHIALGIAEGLSALHARGIIHRDLKPANVMVLPGGSVKLMDFGLARIIDASIRLTKRGEFLGTLAYASPEQFGGVAGIPSDLWSLGVILYEMLTGELPFEGRSIVEISIAIRFKHPQPLETLNPNVPPHISQVVSRLLEKDISHRLSSADEVCRALEQRAGPGLAEFLNRSVAGGPDETRLSDPILPLVVDFQGRVSERRRVLDLLWNEQVSAVAVTGLRGMGKSALLAEVANEAHEMFRDGSVYLDVRAERLSWLLICERLFNQLEFDAGGRRLAEALMQCLLEHPILLIIDSVEELPQEDWKEVLGFIAMVERERMVGGFEKLPSALLFGSRVLPEEIYDLPVEEVPLTGLSDNEGAELLRRKVRDHGPREWETEKEREWVSNRVGGHPEMLRLLAVQARHHDYAHLKDSIKKMSGKLLQRVEEVVGWSVGRLGPEGVKLAPYFGCFSGLSCDSDELAAAASMSTSSLEFEEGLDQLHYSGGLIRWDPVGRRYRFHASFYRWAAGRFDADEMKAAYERIAESWEARFINIPSNPRNAEDLAPILSAIEYRTKSGRTELALDYLDSKGLKTPFGGQTGEPLWQLMRRLGLYPRLHSVASNLASGTNRTADPETWARAMRMLGIAWNCLTTGHRAENALKSIACNERVLEVWTRETHPIEWAKVKGNLGIAWANYPAGDKSANMSEAIKCYEEALKAIDRDSEPIVWARTTASKGQALLFIPTGDKAQNLARASDCFYEALEVFTRETAPREWANTLLNLGIVLKELPKGDRAKNYDRAIECFDEALKVRTREAAPMMWASSMNNLGIIWRDRPCGDRQENLKKAIECFDGGLEVQSRERAPFDWAITVGNKAVALRSLLTENRSESLTEAVDLHLAALSVHQRKEDPWSWADDHYELGLTWLAHLDLPDGQASAETYLKKAEECFKLALEVWTEDEFDRDHAKAQAALKRVRTWRRMGVQPD